MTLITFAKLTGSAAIVLIIAGIVSGCSSSMPSKTQPGFEGTTFHRVAVVAAVEETEWKQRIESQIVTAFKLEGIDAIESMTLAGGIMGMTDSTAPDLLRKNNCDSYLIITTGDEGSTMVKDPAKNVIDRMPLPEDEWDRWRFITTTRKIIVPGDNTTYPAAELHSLLYEAGSGKLAWSAVSHNQMNVYSNLSLVIKGYCNKVVAQLIRDGRVRAAQ